VVESVEEKLLLAGGRSFLGTAKDEEVLQDLRRPLDWRGLFRRAEHEGLSGLLHSEILRLVQTHDLDLPLHSHTRAVHHVFARNGAYLAELSWLRGALRERGLQVIVLKGGALIQTVYGGRLGLRPLSDLDLLIKACDLSAIEAALLERGFRPDSPSSMYFTKGFLAVDLHTSLIGEEWVGRKALAFSLDADELWRTALPLDGRDPAVLMLSPPYQFLHLAIHALKHSFSRLIWLIDLGLVSRCVTWPQVLDLAKASGALRPVAYGLAVLKAVMRVDVPADVRAGLPRLNKLEKIFVSSVVRRSATETFGELLVAFSIRGARGKVSYLSELCFPRRGVLTRHYPSTRGWLLYPHRVFRLVTLGFREVRRIARI
jgi:hypothetical protein